MNTSSMRIYERLRKRSLRYRYKRGFIDDQRSAAARRFNTVWLPHQHEAYVRGVRDALEAVEADINKAYEEGFENGALFMNDEVVGALI